MPTTTATISITNDDVYNDDNDFDVADGGVDGAHEKDAEYEDDDSDEADAHNRVKHVLINNRQRVENTESDSSSKLSKVGQVCQENKLIKLFLNVTFTW